MRVGIATDHGGFSLKKELITRLRAAGPRDRGFRRAHLECGLRLSRQSRDNRRPRSRCVRRSPRSPWPASRRRVISFFFQTEPAVIGGNAHTHISLLQHPCARRSAGPQACPRASSCCAAAGSASTTAWSCRPVRREWPDRRGSRRTSMAALSSPVISQSTRRARLSAG